ncbi:hypothetical protein ACFQ58_03510 [Agromyces sp. NPDC056523]|uniref:hypothetical protein n=1 Tax=Agromyces sp. NPDC056523 TaxID=3345850 RepID=UPI00366FE99A
MDWTFWVGGAVIVVALIVTQVFLHESRWSRRPRPEDEHNPDPMIREEPDDRDGPSDPPGPPDGDLR